MASYLSKLGCFREVAMYKHRPQKQYTNVGDFIRDPSLVWRLPKEYLANSADPDQTLVLQNVKLKRTA